jgi:hypothetical protein
MDQAALPPQGPPVRRIPVVATVQQTMEQWALHRPVAHPAGWLSVDANRTYQLDLAGWTFRYREPERDYAPCLVALSTPSDVAAGPFSDLRGVRARISGGFLFGNVQRGTEIEPGAIYVDRPHLLGGIERTRLCEFQPAPGSGYIYPAHRTNGSFDEVPAHRY